MQIVKHYNLKIKQKTNKQKSIKTFQYNRSEIIDSSDDVSSSD